jgi:hypothetical protein
LISKVSRSAVLALLSGPASAAGDIEPLDGLLVIAISASFLAALCLTLAAVFFLARWLIHSLLCRFR